jgi:hypothetical protein
MSRFLPLLALACIVGSPVLAASCPDAKDAKTGFVLERSGTRAEIRPASEHLVHVVNHYPSGKKQDVIYFRGLFVISRFDDTARAINIPLSDLRTVFPLASKSRRAITYAPAQPGKIGNTVSLELTVMGEEKVRLGPCSYDVLVIRNRFMNAEGRKTYEDTDLYSPELGFLLGKRYDEPGGRQTTISYDRIGPLPPPPL